jgi:hypothetical protein
MLVYEVLDEAVQSTDFCSVRLFCTARNIFELYSAVVPTHHKEFLETIPQQVGEFHVQDTKSALSYVLECGVYIVENRVSMNTVINI